MRIHRALARAGVASRRKAEELVKAGRVQVDGRVARVGEIVDPTASVITIDGARVGAPARSHWIVLHKPRGYVTSRRDPEGRRTVFDLVEDRPGLTYVGRLDYQTEGVLLLTTDGDAAHKLTHPSRGVERTYVATVRGDGRGAAEHARQGVDLTDGPVRPSHVSVRRMAGGLWAFSVTITEGRTREVRRLCTELGLDVERLVRTQFGPVKLGNLRAGKTRELTSEEKAGIARAVR